MEAGDTHAADLVDTVHLEMDSMVRSHRFCKSVVANNRRTTHPIEGACQPINRMNLQYVAVINDYQIVDLTPSKFYSQIMWYYITRRGSVIRCQASVML